MLIRILVIALSLFQSAAIAQTVTLHEPSFVYVVQDLTSENTITHAIFEHYSVQGTGFYRVLELLNSGDETPGPILDSPDKRKEICTTVVPGYGVPKKIRVRSKVRVRYLDGGYIKSVHPSRSKHRAIHHFSGRYRTLDLPSHHEVNCD